MTDHINIRTANVELWTMANLASSKQCRAIVTTTERQQNMAMWPLKHIYTSLWRKYDTYAQI